MRCVCTAACFASQANHFFFTALLLVFAVYGCVFDEASSVDNSDQLLMYSWAWSMVQRFVVNEPVIIFFSVIIPLLSP